MSKESQRNEQRKKLLRQIISVHLFGKNSGARIKYLKAKAEALGLIFEDLLRQAFRNIDLIEEFASNNSAFEIETLDSLVGIYTTFDFPKLSTKAEVPIIPGGSILRPFHTEGDSMQDAGILDGDVVLVEPGIFESGQIAVVRVFDKYFVKQVVASYNSWSLLSANPKYPPIEIDGSFDFEIIGRVKYLMRKIS